MIHDNTLAYWGIGTIISLIIAFVFEVFDKDTDKSQNNTFGIVLGSALQLPIVLLIACVVLLVIHIITGKDPLDDSKISDATIEEFAPILLSLWTGIVLFTILTFDSHYGKDFEDKTPKTEMTQAQYNQECREKKFGDLIFFNTENLHNSNLVCTFAPSNK